MHKAKKWTNYDKQWTRWLRICRLKDGSRVFQNKALRCSWTLPKFLFALHVLKIDISLSLPQKSTLPFLGYPKTPSIQSLVASACCVIWLFKLWLKERPMCCSDIDTYIVIECPDNTLNATRFPSASFATFKKREVASLHVFGNALALPTTRVPRSESFVSFGALFRHATTELTGKKYTYS